MNNINYILEVLCHMWSILLLIGFMAIPILWIWIEHKTFNDYDIPDSEKEKFNTKDNSIDPIDGSKQEL